MPVDCTETEEKLRPLFRELLDALHRGRDALLQEGIDSARIVHAAVQSYVTGPPAHDPAELQDGRSVCAGLDRLVQRILGDGLPHESRSEREAQSLAGWLEHFHAVLHQVHPRAVEITNLLAEGYPIREIAQRLALGLRLTERIVLDMRRRWTPPQE